MTIIQLLIFLVIIGVVLYLINTVIPMDAVIKKIVNIVVILVVLLYVAGAFGLLDGVGHLRIR